MARIPQREIAKIKKAIEAAKMGNASFGFPNHMVKHNPHMERERTEHVDVAIKELTRNYRHSWIIGPLEEFLEWAEGNENDA